MLMLLSIPTAAFFVVGVAFTVVAATVPVLPLPIVGEFDVSVAPTETTAASPPTIVAVLTDVTTTTLVGPSGTDSVVVMS